MSLVHDDILVFHKVSPPSGKVPKTSLSLYLSITFSHLKTRKNSAVYMCYCIGT